MSTLPAAEIAEGPLGLEALHTWNGLTMNALNSFPRYNLTTINGLYSRAESEEVSDPAQGSIGEITYPSMPRGKTIVYNGVIEALSLPSLRAAITNLKAYFADTISEHFLTISPATGRGGVSWTGIGKAMALDIDEDQQRPLTAVFPHARGFSASIRLVDPRFYTSADPVSAAGGAVVGVTNLGNAPADPIFTLTGPITSSGYGPRIERTTPDARILTFKTSIAWAAFSGGQHLVVVFGRIPMAYSPELGGDFSTLVKFDSTWWDDGAPGIIPGSQQVSASHCAAWSVTYSHAVW